MKVLFTTHPGSGHVYPMIPIARALARAGHQVTFATSARFSEQIFGFGFRAVDAGHDWLASEVWAAFPEAGELEVVKRNHFLLHELFAKRLVRPMVEDLVRHVAAERPDLIVRETWEFGGAFAGELCGVPCAVASTALNFEIWRPLVAEALSARRVELGLAADPDARFLDQELVLDHVPPSLQYPSLPVPAQRQAIGRAFVEDDGWSNETAPVILDAPVVYVAGGAASSGDAGYLRVVVEALADEQVRVVVTSGMRGLSPRDLGISLLPNNVTLTGHIPRNQILPHSAVMISHGGFSGVLGAVNQGVPMVTVPVGADHGQNGLRVAAAGCGICLPYHDHVKEFPQCGDLAAAPLFAAESVRDAVRRVLVERSFSLGSRKLQLEALAMPGAAAVVRSLERFAALGEGRARAHNRPEAAVAFA